MKDIKVKSVAEYLCRINEIILLNPNMLYRYRGEAKAHTQPNKPNIFRTHTQDLLDNPNFERSILDSLRSKKLSDANSYFELAIDAQHGGFPTRLLDVSSNALIALYFATENHIDDDGKVYMFYFDEIYPAVSDNMHNLYDAILCGDQVWRTEGIFKYNHRLIGHYKRNDRIAAQQGEFILFQGNEFEQVPDYTYSEITILSTSKDKIRTELKNILGIDESYVYPEIEHAKGALVEQSKHYKYPPNTLEQEIDFFISTLDHNLDAFEDKIIKSKMSESDSLIEVVLLERYLKEIAFSIRISFQNIIASNPKKEDIVHKKYNELRILVNEKLKFYENHLHQHGITISPFPCVEVDCEK